MPDSTRPRRPDPNLPVSCRATRSSGGNMLRLGVTSAFSCVALCSSRSAIANPMTHPTTLATTNAIPRAILKAITTLALCGLSVSTLAQPAAAPAVAHPASASAVSDDPAVRWHDSLERFAAADRLQPPAAGGVLFVGSSSIRLWTGLPEAFPELPVVIQRGFGGSTLAECAALVSTLVLPYRPSVVVLYAGDNDIAAGVEPQALLASFKQFVDAVRSQLPETRIDYVSIKLSPLRKLLAPHIEEANQLIEAYTRTLPNLAYIDVYSKMIDADRQPRLDLYRADKLHLNASGYAIWQAIIAKALGLGPRPGAVPVRTTDGQVSDAGLRPASALVSGSVGGR